MTWSVHAACRRTIPERIAVRPAAISAGGGIDAGVRYHGLRQSGARLALHDGRLLCRQFRGLDRELHPRRGAGARRHLAAWHHPGIRGASASLRTRSSRSCAGDVWPDLVFQRCRAADLGPRGACASAAALADGADRDPARHLLSSLPPGDHRGRAGRGADALSRRDANAPGHADPRRRVEPGNDRGARHQYQAALYAGVRARRSARRPRRADAGADPDRSDRDGRKYPHSRVRHYRDRRHRLDPRRLSRGDLRRHDRYAGPCIPARPAAAGPELCRRFDRGSGALIDAHLSGDGHCAGGAAGGAVSGQPVMKAALNVRNAAAVLVVAGLLVLPLYTSLSGNVFALTLFTRIVIFALAAASLNLIMGYGGMMSFGHAAYLGIGGYAVGILAAEGIGSGFIQWPVALLASALFALVIGALSLRTRGVYFIMITLAFAQMAYYVASGLARYGGDDGLTIYKRSDFGGLINLSNRVQFYYLCLACLLGGLYLIWRIVNSRFGMVVQGLRSNEARMQAIGFPATRYRLVCFVISGTMCGLAGALLANNTDFVSPAVMYWTRSGDLMVMVILGGMGSLFGPVIGAA